MDLLAGREGFAPDLPHSYEASEAFRRDYTPDSKRGGYPTPPYRQFSKTLCNGCCRVGPAVEEIEGMIMLFAAANGGRSPWRTYPGRWIKPTLVQIGEQDRSDDKTVFIIKRNYVA